MLTSESIEAEEIRQKRPYSRTKTYQNRRDDAVNEEKTISYSIPEPIVDMIKSNLNAYDRWLRRGRNKNGLINSNRMRNVTGNDLDKYREVENNEILTRERVQHR